MHFKLTITHVFFFQLKTKSFLKAVYEGDLAKVSSMVDDDGVPVDVSNTVRRGTRGEADPAILRLRDHKTVLVAHLLIIIHRKKSAFRRASEMRDRCIIMSQDRRTHTYRDYEGYINKHKHIETHIRTWCTYTDTHRHRDRHTNTPRHRHTLVFD